MMRITVAKLGGNNAELEPLSHWRDATYLVPRMAALEQKLDRLLLAGFCLPSRTQKYSWTGPRPLRATVRARHSITLIW